MDNPTPHGSPDADLRDCVVAWHNKSLLTCRILASHVTGIGVVTLPCVDSPTGSSKHPVVAPGAPSGRVAALRARIELLAQGPGWLRSRRKSQATPLFDEDFIPPLTPRMVSRFARQHGDAQRPADAAWRRREIKPLDSAARHGTLYLRTAAIEYGGHRLRVLIGQGAKPHIIGPRLWNRKRLSGWLAGLGLFAMVATALPFLPAAVPTDASRSLSLAKPTEPHATSAGAPPLLAAGSSAVASAEAETEIGVAEADQSASAPHRFAVDPADDPARARGPPAAVSGTAQPHFAGRAAAAPASVPTAQWTTEPIFALATEPTRSRASSMLRLSLINLPTEPQKDGAHAELMKVGPQWRVVIWPYGTPEAADKAREPLSRRGVKVELIAF